MAHFNNSTTWNESCEENNNSFNNYDFKFCNGNRCYDGKKGIIIYVSTLAIICIGLPLTLLAIYSLSSLVRKDHGAPLYIINLLISDLVQFLCMIVWVAKKIKICNKLWETLKIIYHYGLLSSVGFMVCISLERYLVIVCPLWYRFRRTIKTSVVVCALVWILPPVFFLPFYYSLGFLTTQTIVGAFLLLPLPLFIFFLGGTLKALSGSISVSSDEKRRIVAVLVVVLLIYTLLFMPTVILVFLVAITDRTNFELWTASNILIQLSPLADLILYFFMIKGATDKILMQRTEPTPVVHAKIKSFLDEHDVLEGFQSGFKTLHSTESALPRVFNDILLTNVSGDFVVLVLT
ncbi:mas-related G-protein coupled receptor member A6-like [Mugil cephalus]|uniref:mas-related G-protein coupled receptor member A6-like n=1 Tax=Mugil cephalus TaxID=48193 RepID=UPI001FB72928|nr:mas-related G-protein coupled receptor member A6-like [Mugil cephalus]